MSRAGASSQGGLLQKTARKTGVVIEPGKGEKALAVLSELGLLDRSYKIRRSKTELFIPILRVPSKNDLEVLEEAIGRFSTSMDEYEAHRVRPDSLEDALSLLPVEVRIQLPRAFDIIGDLAVIELTPATEPFQGLISDALMNVHPNVKAVYAKAGPIGGEERVRPLRHIAGESRTFTLHHEFGSTFRVDIASVFFSPRLSQEHERVARLVRAKEQVVDMFAGVGPFSILIARRLQNVRVEAVELNTRAAQLLEENVRLNHVTDRVRVWKGDARIIVEQEKELSGTATRVIMNHPSQAQQFIDSATRALSPDGGVVHYYTFSKGPEPENFAVEELEDSLESIDWNIEQTLHVRKVRAISPMSWQVVVDAQIGPA